MSGRGRQMSRHEDRRTAFNTTWAAAGRVRHCMRPNAGRHGPNKRRLRPSLGRARPPLGRARLKLGRVRPKPGVSGAAGAQSATSCPVRRGASDGWGTSGPNQTHNPSPDSLPPDGIHPTHPCDGPRLRESLIEGKRGATIAVLSNRYPVENNRPQAQSLTLDAGGSLSSRHGLLPLPALPRLRGGGNWRMWAPELGTFG